MKQTEILEILESTSVGAEVAEHETELPRVFINDIEVYRRLINDEVDLITGGKGTGKSAIYRMITETTISDDLTVIPASNPTGSPEFRALFTGKDSEQRLRSIWVVYIASLVANHVVDTYEGVPPTAKSVAELREILELMGLRLSKQKNSLLERIRRAKTVEGGIKGGAAGLELGVSLKFELEDEGGDQRAGSAIVLEYPDFFALLRRSADVLRAHQYRFWVAIDRLDECFTRNSETERRALRSLLRATLDCAHALQYDSSIRVKVFLRTDLFTISSEDGAFTNATHLRRNDISWTFNSMADLIAHRLMSDTRFARCYLRGVRPVDKTREAWDALLPDMGTRKPGKSRIARYSTAQTFCLWTADGSRLYNPRNLISLVNLALLRARENQRRALNMGRAARRDRPLIAEGEVQAAMGELGRRRFQDTIINEFPAVASLAAKLRGGPAEYDSKAQLLHRLGLSNPNSSEAREALSLLILCGLVGTSPRDRFYLPRLYRSAISTSSTGG
jgi:hypothetical protein